MRTLDDVIDAFDNYVGYTLNRPDDPNRYALYYLQKYKADQEKWKDEKKELIAQLENAKQNNWRTMFQEPAEDELVLIAIPPNIITLGIWNGMRFTNAKGQTKAEAHDVAYWMPLTNPWRKKDV